jgi:hypothetical protein
MTKPIIFVVLLALGCAPILRASAQGSNEAAYAATKADCEQKADAKNFGIHHAERHRFVVRCVAGLSQR